MPVGGFGGLHEGAGGAGEGDGGEPVHLGADARPTLAGGVLGDPGEEQGETADQDVGADAVLEAPSEDV